VAKPAILWFQSHQCVNKVMLIGFLGDAPELKFSQQGKPVCTFSIAVNERWKDPAGSPLERVEWFKIVCFGRLAEVSGEYLSKGRHLPGRPVAHQEVGRPRRRKAYGYRSCGQPDADSGSCSPERERSKVG